MDDLNLLLARHGVLLVFVVTFAARAGAPLPAAPLLVVGGALSVAGQLSGTATLVASLLANVLGDAVWFGGGRRWGYRMMGLLCRISLSPDSCVRQSESMILRWGGLSLVAAKFVPGVSVIAAPMAGAVGMRWSRFLLWGALGACVWTLLYFGLGVMFSARIESALDAVERGGALAGALLVLVLAAVVLLRYWRRYRFLREVSMPRISAAELQALMADGAAPIVIDVRSQAAVPDDGDRIPGARVAELHELERLASELPRDRDVVLYCNCPNEASAARGAAVLLRLGVSRARPLAGGLDAWRALQQQAGPTRDR